MAAQVQYGNDGKATASFDDSDADAAAFDQMAETLHDARERLAEAKSSEEEARSEVVSLIGQTFRAEDIDKTRIIKGNRFRLTFSKGTPGKTKEEVDFDTFWEEMAKIVPADTMPELTSLRERCTKVTNVDERPGRVLSIDAI